MKRNWDDGRVDGNRNAGCRFLRVVIRHCSRCAAKTELCVTLISFEALVSFDSKVFTAYPRTPNAFGAHGFSRRPKRLRRKPQFRISKLEILREAHFLLRKEVIQPQVPLRLPCYDFIPVTAHSVGGCLLAVSAPTSATSDSHDVTGGVYKARERIHGAVADAPLLAIPASWSRVADSNPNWAQFSIDFLHLAVSDRSVLGIVVRVQPWP